MRHKTPATSSNNLTPEESVARYKAILASTLDPIVIINSRGIIQSASDSIERVFGYAPEELIGRNVNVLMPEPHRSQHDGYLTQYHQTGQTNILGRTREFDVVKKDGTLFPIALSVSRVEIPEQDEPLFAGIIHDLTSRRQVEQERSLLQRLALGISSANDLDAALVIALKEICDMTGWDYGEAWLPSHDDQTLSNSAYWHQPTRDFADFRKATRGMKLKPGQGLPGRVLASKKPEWRSNLTPPERDIFLRSNAARQAGLKAGFAMPILVADTVVAVVAFYARRKHEADHHLLELVAAAIAPVGAVIQRRRAENALIESERRFRDMLNNTNLIAVMIDREGTITFCDDYLLKVTGYASRDDVVGCNWFDRFIPREERDEVYKLFLSGLGRGEIEPYFENHILTRHGEKRLIAWSNTLLRDPGGNIIGATAFGMDITERRRIEAELERHRHHLEHLVSERTKDLETTHQQLRMADRLASIGTLTAGLGHDMNNMLLPMRCRLEAIDQMNVPPQMREQISAIRHSVDYLQQLTDGLQLFALDPEDEEASSVTTDIHEWWQLVGPLLSRAVSKSTQFAATIPDDLPPVAVPSHRLTQAILNLIVNAGEAVEDRGHVQFRVSNADDGRFVRLRVIDNGCGMSDDVRQHVLEPFFTTKKRGLGTGLGLSLVRGVVQHAGGSIKIDSEPGRGTIVTMLLPAATVAPPSADQDLAPDQITASITISDARLATFIVVLLQGADIAVELKSSDGVPDSDLWFADDDPNLHAAMRTYLKHAPRLLILYNRNGNRSDGRSEGSELVSDNVVFIDKPDNFESIRRIINDAIEQVRTARESLEPAS